LHFVAEVFSRVRWRLLEGFDAASPVLAVQIFHSPKEDDMKYMIEPIGAAFSNKAVDALADRFTTRAKDGYKLHSVFQVSQPGCLGIGQGTTTYLAVYAKED
jgi:hypothetical protein